MKNTWKLILLLGILLLVAVILMSQTVVSVAQDATAVPALVPTPIGGGENGVMSYMRGIIGGENTVLGYQKDLSDLASITSVLSYDQVEEKLGKKLGNIQIVSISPDGKMVYMEVFKDPDEQVLAGVYLASVDLSFLGRLSNDISAYMFWSPDSTGMMGEVGMGFYVLRRGKTRVISNYIPGNLLAWSKDSKAVYGDDGRNHLIVLNVADGSQKQMSVPFLTAINRPNTRYGPEWERINGLMFLPDSDKILLLTITEAEPRITVYETTSDFSDASVLATFTGVSGCNPFTYNLRGLSPNGQYLWIAGECDSRIINTADGSGTINKSLLFDDKGAWRRTGCGWSPDNHFVTTGPSGSGGASLSFWEPTTFDKPVLSLPFVIFCPTWLPAPAAS